MQTSVRTIEDGVLELTVNLDKAELVDYVTAAEQQIGADVELPGFRKGKAPKEMIRQRIDENVIRELALELAVSGSLRKAIEEKELDVAKTEKIQVKENKPERLTYSLLVSVFPAVKLPELADISVTRTKTEISEKEITEALDVIRNMRSRFEDKDGPALTGDRVEVDFRVSDGGAAIEGGESHNHPLIIGGKNFMPGFEEQLVGMSKGEEKDFQLTAPKDYYQKKIAGKKLDFHVSIKMVQSVHLPELNDEFAKSLGRFSDLAGLRVNVEKGIRQEKDEKEKDKARLAVLEKIAGKTKINPPAFMVEQQLEVMVSQFDRDLRGRGLEMSMYLSQIGKGLEELKKDWRNDAVRQATFSVILRSLIKQRNIRPDEKEIELAFNEALQELAIRGQADPNSINPEELKGRIADRMTQERAFEYIDTTCVKEA